MKKSLFVLVVTLAFAGCSKYTPSQKATIDLSKVDYFAFGDSYGFCSGDCSSLFLLKDNALYPDDMTRLTAPLVFKDQPLPAGKRDLAKALRDKFPGFLANHADSTFGCPDCHDQGVIYIEYKINNQTKWWRIDPVVERQPVDIRPFIEELKTTIAQLKQ